uniref:DNA-directed RNA polymerase RBP11-like dimerisation domain-containing protein n=1 Tax=Nothobranchius furzeri TaxID=105023 RepID=A0A8C6KFH9_NOTFU
LNTTEQNTSLSRMVQADGADEGCVTFVMHDEDHTLGNSLRYMIMKKSVTTHPLIERESKLIICNVPVCGSTRGVPAVESLRKGLNDLHDVGQHVLNTFQVHLNGYQTFTNIPQSCGSAEHQVR